MTLHGGLEEKLNMGIKEDVGKHISMKNGKEPENISRRSFMQKLFGLGAGALVGGTGTVYSDDANAAITEDILPPGFQICPDTVLRRVYLMMLDKRPLYESEKIKGALVRNGKIGDVNTGFVKDETPLTEPAYWFAINYFNYIYNSENTRNRIFQNDFPIKYEELQKKNPAMYNWALGIAKYFTTWVAEKKTGTPLETEIYLLRAIFTASGKNESDVEDYKKLNLQLKERKLQEIIAGLEKQDKQNQLIASWASTWLTNHYWTLDTQKEYLDLFNLFNNKLEMPLRKYGRVRAYKDGPFYLNHKL